MQKAKNKKKTNGKNCKIFREVLLTKQKQKKYLLDKKKVNYLNK